MPLTVSLVTPSRQVFEESCNSVKLPTHAGEMGVFPGHAALVALMGKGALHTSGDQGKTFLVRGGFVQVFEDRVSILVDEALDPKTLDREPLTARENEIEEQLKNVSLELEQRDRLYEERDWIQLCLKHSG